MSEVVLNDQIKKRLLKVIPGSERLIIDACNGEKTFHNAKNIFPAGIDGAKKRWKKGNLGTQIIPTTRTIVQVHCIKYAEEFTIDQLFSSLRSDINNLLLTENQIIDFCEKHPEWLNTNRHGTLFLTKIGPRTFIANIDTFYNGLGGVIDHFEIIKNLKVGIYVRIVAPKATVYGEK